jgi:exodeoxyribonuclease V alpha subunit
MSGRSTGEGNICLDLPSLAGGKTLEFGETPFITPPISDWLPVLAGNSAVGRPGDYRPLILDQKGRLYLYRYWNYESSLLAFIRGRAQGEGGSGDSSPTDTLLLREKLNLLFPPETGASGPNWQKLAAAIALRKKFTVISGSPGTGKTTAVTKIMTLLIEMSKDKPINIALTAPTGKAAVRLSLNRPAPFIVCWAVGLIRPTSVTIRRILYSQMS